MVGPDLKGLGGISRVAKTWEDCEFFSDFNIKYISSVTDRNINNIIFLFKNFFIFLYFIIKDTSCVYIHSSSYNSSHRKSLFILPSILLGKKIVLHIHPTHFYKFLLELKGVNKYYVFFLLKRISGFVVLTRKMQANINSMFPDKQVYVLKNPIDVKQMNINKEYTRHNNQLLFLGWYIKEKGIYELVDAVEILFFTRY